MSFPDRQTILDFLKKNPEARSQADIARGLRVKGRERAVLREILRELQEEGLIERTGKRSFARPDQPPASGLVEFTRLTADGDLIGQCVGDKGLFGPELVYAGPAGRNRVRAPGKGDRAICRIADGRNGEWRAYAITTLEKRSNERSVGLYERGPHGGRVIPASRKERRQYLIQQADARGARDGDLVIVEPKPQGRRQYGPLLGIVREIVGHISDPRSASLIAIHAHDIPCEFSEAALSQARSAVPAPVTRTDLRDIPLITIDPEDARDHDDAVWAGPADNGGWKVIVAIADVAAYVTEGSPLDREAEKRGNSTYFPDRVVPMLPFELSADACSLKEGEERFCIAVEMNFSADGTKRHHHFFRGVMRSAASLSYEQAQAAIDGAPAGRAAEILDTVLKPLWGAYEAVSHARERRSPLDLDMPERRIFFDPHGMISTIAAKERLDAHRLIEEFMILANVSAAETLRERNMPVMYRVHDVPSDAKLAAFADFLQTLDMKWTVGERPQTNRFNRLLAEIRGGEYEGMISQMVLRTQAQAIYSDENIGHFGLNLKEYAHFTSPIRRYADLVVHRALIRAHGFGPDGLSEHASARLEEIAAHISATERRSMAAERDATDRYLALFLADRVGAEFEGRISGVTPAGLFISLAGSGADGFIPISSLSEDYWIHDEAAMAIFERGSGRSFSLGQIVRVRLLEVIPLQGSVLLEMLSDPGPPSGRRSEGGREDRRRSGSRPGGPRAPAKRGRAKFNRSSLPGSRKRGRK